VLSFWRRTDYCPKRIRPCPLGIRREWQVSIGLSTSPVREELVVSRARLFMDISDVLRCAGNFLRRQRIGKGAQLAAQRNQPVMDSESWERVRQAFGEYLAQVKPQVVPRSLRHHVLQPFVDCFHPVIEDLVPKRLNEFTNEEDLAATIFNQIQDELYFASQVPHSPWMAANLFNTTEFDILLLGRIRFEIQKHLNGGKSLRVGEELAEGISPGSARSEVPSGVGNGSQIRTWIPRSGRLAKGARKRNTTYEKIDKALRAIGKSQPDSHKEVFEQLGNRKVPLPNRKPFRPAGGWLEGFEQDKHTASVWLSQACSRLGFPYFPRGPKKK
jgi:hypothetical protein